MKTDIKYYPNDRIKHKIYYYNNGNKCDEFFYDENEQIHREDNFTALQKWYNNGYLIRKIYAIHGHYHNISNPANIEFLINSKIENKEYSIHDLWLTKLSWMNRIKNI